jgi:UDP-glucose 4-epimerase
VGSSQGISVNELVTEINRALNTDLPPIYREARSGEVRHSRADISKIRKILGYEPRVTLRAGLSRLIDSIQ